MTVGIIGLLVGFSALAQEPKESDDDSYISPFSVPSSQCAKATIKPGAKADDPDTKYAAALCAGLVALA